MPHVNEVAVKNWEDFDSQADRILEEFEAKKGATDDGHFSHPLFRGQADHGWPLRTTLERFSTKPFSLDDYYRVLRAVAPAVASLTSRQWEVDEDDNLDDDPPRAYPFMVYLRHHGFPSPLLDWSRSPHVAAFFAFAERTQSEAVAVFGFREYVGHGKTSSGDGARIVGLGPYTATHERHYSQQCEYTICKKKVGDGYIYCAHEEALRDRVVPQDVLTKYVIPATERGRFLRRLESMNIHAYSLFRDESSLMQTLAYREIEVRERP